MPPPPNVCNMVASRPTALQPAHPIIRQRVRPATGAAGRRGNDAPLARQMLKKRLARGSCSAERLDAAADRSTLAHSLVLAGARLQLLQAEFEVVDQQSAALGTLPEDRPAQLLVLQLEQGDAGRQICADRLRTGSRVARGRRGDRRRAGRASVPAAPAAPDRTSHAAYRCSRSRARCVRRCEPESSPQRPHHRRHQRGRRVRRDQQHSPADLTPPRIRKAARTRN